MPPYSVKAIANEFLKLAGESGKPLTPMKLQKLVYFAHGWHLALRNQPLVDEHPEAWTYGPVFPTLYHAFKQFGGGPIQSPATDVRFSVNPATGRETIIRFFVPSMDESPDGTSLEFARSVIRKVWEVYGSWSGVQLSQLTHEQKSPWHVTRQSNPDRTGTDIPDDDIRDYFAKKVRLTA